MTSTPPPAPPTADPPPWQPSPPPGPPARPPVRRSREDKVLGGVAGGLADYSGIDALLWRVGFVALALGGPGIPVYLLLWLLMPVGPAGPSGAAAGFPGSQRAPRAVRPRSPVPRVTLAGLLIVVGALVLLSRLTSWDAEPRFVVGAGLLVVGLGLVAAAFSDGRTAKGGLITLGVLLTVASIVAAAEPWDAVEGGVGDRSYAPQTVEAVRPEYRLGAGNLRLDLTDVPLGDLDAALVTRVGVGAGNIEVLVPRSADVRLVVDDRMGEIDVLDVGAEGGFSAGTGAAWSGDADPEIVLTIDGGMGNVEVSRA